MSSKNTPETLIEDMLASKGFFPSRERTQLFKYLWENRDRVSPALDIWEGVLHAISISKKKDKPLDEYDYKTSVRQSCLDLKRELNKYFANKTEGWYFDLPHAERGAGYKLSIIRLDDPDSPTMAFWRPHFEHSHIALVYAQPMFYLDRQTLMYLHCLDTSTHSGSRDEAWSDLETRHPAELHKLYGDPTKKLTAEEVRKFYDEVVRTRLRPAHNFIGIGEMLALDVLDKWFQRNPFVAVEKIPNQSINTLKGISPILTGSHRNNKFIGLLLNSPEGGHLRYRLHETKVGYLAIKQTEDREKTALEKTAAAVVSDIPAYEENGCTVVPVTPIPLSFERTRFAIVTRMPKPGGSGSVTMICSDTPLAIEQVALALTIEGHDQRSEKKPQMANILKALGWPKRPLPASFELLFSVKIGPGGFEDAGEAPQLLLASSY